MIFRLLLIALGFITSFAVAEPARDPLFRTIDIDRGETQQVELAGGQKVKVKLLDVQENAIPCDRRFGGLQSKSKSTARPPRLHR